MLDFADLIAINKFDKRGAHDALRDVRKQYQRTHNLWETAPEKMPVYGTIASQFNDPGMNQLYGVIVQQLNDKIGLKWKSRFKPTTEIPEKIYIIPPARTRYLSEITDTIRQYNIRAEQQSEVAGKLQNLVETQKLLAAAKQEVPTSINDLKEALKRDFDGNYLLLLEAWPEKKANYQSGNYFYEVRGKKIEVETHTPSLSGTPIPKVALPKYSSWKDLLRWHLQENVPGEFPFTAGVFPFKRKGEDPTRMFAGEGGPERTNKRFHYLSQGQPAARLSTAFDSVTLYGEDPDYRPDIYGKIGNSGVNVCCLDDAKKLYSGFDLSAPTTSVSMTINGPAAAITAFFMNAAIDQQCELYIKENGLEEEVKAKITKIYANKNAEIPTYLETIPEGNNGLGLMLLGISGGQVLSKEIYENIKARTLSTVRGTVQADILKEDQAQNTCIFSTEFSLRLMGDMQAFFTNHKVKNFYSVSISGYHIAEAGAKSYYAVSFNAFKRIYLCRVLFE